MAVSFLRCCSCPALCATSTLGIPWLFSPAFALLASLLFGQFSEDMDNIFDALLVGPSYWEQFAVRRENKTTIICSSDLVSVRGRRSMSQARLLPQRAGELLREMLQREQGSGGTSGSVLCLWGQQSASR